MKSIKADLDSGSFKPAYLLYGEEKYLIRQYRDRLVQALVPDADTMNFARYTGKDVDTPDGADSLKGE